MERKNPVRTFIIIRKPDGIFTLSYHHKDDSLSCVQRLSYHFTSFNRKEFNTTLTLDIAIRALPHIGVNFTGGSAKKR